MAFFFKRVTSNPKNILISRTDRIGDFILTLPVFEATKKIMNVRITVLCSEAVKPLIKNNPYIDDVIYTKSDDFDFSTIKEIKSRAFDALLVMVNDPLIRKYLPHLSSIPIRIGPLSKPSTIIYYNYPVIQKRSSSKKNEAAYNLELLKVFNQLDVPHPKPRLYLSEEEIQGFLSNHEQLIKKLLDSSKWIILHPGMKGSALNMKLSFYNRLLEELIKKGFHVWLTGSGNAEFEQIQKMVSQLNKDSKQSVSNVVGKFNLRELCILISLSQLFIGPSTGPTHIANAVDTPVISFYPPITVQSARRWEPFLAKGYIFTPDVTCNQKYKCIEERCPHFFCLDNIKIEQVMEKVMIHTQVGQRNAEKSLGL